MLRCYITDRRQVGGLTPLLDRIARALALGVELIQIREKDLPVRELTDFTRAVMALPNPGHSLILINGRPDVALAAGAHGVHLPGGSIAPSELRPILPERFVIGVSCHSRDELFRAQAEDADYTFISPVFRPLSKDDSRPPLGLKGLHDAVEGLQIPSFALGGILPENIADCIAAGVPGVAGISLFQKHLLR
ncbi:MAG: thiamine phosphate synthase [Bryobacterales bacterium]|nr:thiamine phosphate synthase [Bryobacterales bacterium]